MRQNGSVKLTIDSREPLADVLRVVGSLYDVALTTTPTSGSAPAANEALPARSSSRRSSRDAGRARRTTARSSPANARAVREWASQNGFEVSARGSLSTAVRDAYNAAHPSGA